MKLRSTLYILFVCCAIANCSAVFAQDAPLTVKKVYDVMQSKLSDADAEKLAGQLRIWFGKDNQGRDNLAEGRGGAKSDDLYVIWAVDSTVVPRIIASCQITSKQPSLADCAVRRFGCIPVPEHNLRTTNR